MYIVNEYKEYFETNRYNIQISEIESDADIIDKYYGHIHTNINTSLSMHSNENGIQMDDEQCVYEVKNNLLILKIAAMDISIEFQI